MNILPKSPVKTRSKIKFLYVADTAKEKPQQNEIIAIGPLLLLPTVHLN